jgi:hypothetical protein
MWEVKIKPKEAKGKGKSKTQIRQASDQFKVSKPLSSTHDSDQLLCSIRKKQGEIDSLSLPNGA